MCQKRLNWLCSVLKSGPENPLYLGTFTNRIPLCLDGDQCLVRVRSGHKVHRETLPARAIQIYNLGEALSGASFIPYISLKNTLAEIFVEALLYANCSQASAERKSRLLNRDISYA